jgi:predicted  nucleic acid-binding Zn-ribbon protein
MHTDEYEISIAREVNHCQQVVKKTRSRLEERQQKFGMGYPEASLAAVDGQLSIKEKELAAWHDDFEALPQWEQRLEEYREALAVMRISASQF